MCIVIAVFMLGRMWSPGYGDSASVRPSLTHTVIHDRPTLGKPVDAYLNVQHTHDPYGRFPSIMPTWGQIDRPEKVGYLVPGGGNDHLGFHSHYPLFKNRFDQRGYRFEYFTEDRGTRIYLMSRKDGSDKTCNRRSGTDGCAELYDGDNVRINLNDAEYVVKLYTR